MSFSMQINRGLFALSLLGLFAVLGNTVEKADAATTTPVQAISTRTSSVDGATCTTTVVRLRLASAPGDLHQRTLRFATACRA